MVKLIVAWPVAVIEFEYNHRSFQKKASAMRYLTSLKEKNNEIWDKKTSCKQIVKREDKGVKKICRAMLEGSKKSRQYFPFAILCHTQWTSALLRGEKSTTKEKNTKKTQMRLFLSDTHENLCRSLARESDSVVVSVGWVFSYAIF